MKSESGVTKFVRRMTLVLMLMGVAGGAATLLQGVAFAASCTGACSSSDDCAYGCGCSGGKCLNIAGDNR